MKITLVVGTNRPQSMTRRVTGHVETLVRKHLAPQDEVQLLDLSNLSEDIFTPKSYGSKPSSFSTFERAMVETNAIVFVIPEYNGGPPGALKYFIDLLPFPKCLRGKPCSFVGIASGRFGALRAVEQIEAVCQYRHAILFPERTFIPFIEKSVNEHGQPTDEITQKVLHQQIENFVGFARKLL
jgi:NAD(P)H-dependent FMN reductase